MRRFAKLPSRRDAETWHAPCEVRAGEAWNRRLNGSELSWRAWPALERKGTAAAVAAVLLAAVIAVALETRSVVWTVATAAILLGAWSRFFLPSRFRIDDEGISAKYPLGT